MQTLHSGLFGPPPPPPHCLMLQRGGGGGGGGCLMYSFGSAVCTRLKEAFMCTFADQSLKEENTLLSTSALLTACSWHLPLTCHSPATHLPRTCHSPATHLPLTCHSPATHLPLTCHSPAGGECWCRRRRQPLAMRRLVRRRHHGRPRCALFPAAGQRSAAQLAAS